MQDIIHVLGLASVGITVASTGAALAVIYAIFSPTLESEIGEDFRKRPL